MAHRSRDALMGPASEPWLLYRTWAFLSGVELACAAAVCKRWHALLRDLHGARDEQGPADVLWASLLDRDFAVASRVVTLARAPRTMPPAVSEGVRAARQCGWTDIFFSLAQFHLVDDDGVPAMNNVQLYCEFHRRLHVTEEPVAERPSHGVLLLVLLWSARSLARAHDDTALALQLSSAVTIYCLDSQKRI